MLAEIKFLLVLAVLHTDGFPLSGSRLATPLLLSGGRGSREVSYISIYSYPRDMLHSGANVHSKPKGSIYRYMG